MKTKEEYFKLIEDEMTDETREFLANSTDEEKLAKANVILDEVIDSCDKIFPGFKKEIDER